MVDIFRKVKMSSSRATRSAKISTNEVSNWCRAKKIHAQRKFRRICAQKRRSPRYRQGLGRVFHTIHTAKAISMARAVHAVKKRDFAVFKGGLISPAYHPGRPCQLQIIE